MSNRGWIGVDFDGTMAEYTEWKGDLDYGAPVPKMIERMKRYIANGVTFKVFTARVSMRSPELKALVIQHIQDWTELHLGVRLEVTNEKDFAMIELWDDRAVQVEMNTGHFIGKSTRGFI